MINTHRQQPQTKWYISASPREAAVRIKCINLVLCLCISMHDGGYIQLAKSYTAVWLLTNRELFLIMPPMIIMLFDCLFLSCRFSTNTNTQKTKLSPHPSTALMNSWELVRRGWCKEGWTEKDRRWEGREEMNGDRNTRWQSDKEDGGTLDLIIHLRLLLTVLKWELMTCESSKIVFVCRIYWFCLRNFGKSRLPKHVQAVSQVSLWKFHILPSLPFQHCSPPQRNCAHLSIMLHWIKYWSLHAIIPFRYIV